MAPLQRCLDGTDVGASTDSLSTRIGTRAARRKSVWMSSFSPPSPPALGGDEVYVNVRKLLMRAVKER